LSDTRLSEETFSHYGRIGMHWGHRNDGSRQSVGQLSRNNRRADRGDIKIAKAGGAGRAMASTIGKQFVASFITGYGSKLLRATVLKSNPVAQVGVIAANGLVNAGLMARTITSINDISKAEERVATR